MPKGSDSMRSETDMVAAAGTARGGAGPDAGVAARRRGGSAACARRGVNPIRVARTRVSRSGERQGRALRRCLRRGRRRRGGLRLPAGPIPWRAANVTTRYGGAGRMAAAFGRAGAGWRAACAPDLGLAGAMRRRWMWAAATRCWRSAARRRARRWPVAARWTCTRACSRPGNARRAFFKTAIVLAPTGDERMDLVVRRSFADYFCRILLDAAAPLLA